MQRIGAPALTWLRVLITFCLCELHAIVNVGLTCQEARNKLINPRSRDWQLCLLFVESFLPDGPKARLDSIIDI
jgi:hypothetical protein